MIKCKFDIRALHDEVWCRREPMRCSNLRVRTLEVSDSTRSCAHQDLNLQCKLRIFDTNKPLILRLRISDCVGLNIIAEGVAVSVLAERCSDCNLYVAGPRPPDSSFSNSNFVTLTVSPFPAHVPI